MDIAIATLTKISGTEKACWVCGIALADDCETDACKKCLEGNSDRDTADELSAEEY